SLMLSSPHSLYSKVVEHSFPPLYMTRCKIDAFPDEHTKVRLTIYTVITQYLLPIGIISYCYLHIGFFLWRRETVGSLSERRRHYLLRRKKRRVLMLVMVVATFAVCWLPLNI